MHTHAHTQETGPYKAGHGIPLLTRLPSHLTPFPTQSILGNSKPGLGNKMEMLSSDQPLYTSLLFSFLFFPSIPGGCHGSPPPIPTPNHNQPMVRFLSFRLLRRSVAHPQETNRDLHKARLSKCMYQNCPARSPPLGRLTAMGERLSAAVEKAKARLQTNWPPQLETAGEFTVQVAPQHTPL